MKKSEGEKQLAECAGPGAVAGGGESEAAGEQVEEKRRLAISFIASMSFF